LKVGISCLSFSKNGKKLVAAGMDEDHEIAILGLSSTKGKHKYLLI
jgi:hypothetical protein